MVSVPVLVPVQVPVPAQVPFPEGASSEVSGAVVPAAEVEESLPIVPLGVLLGGGEVGLRIQTTHVPSQLPWRPQGSVGGRGGGGWLN